MPRDSRYFFFRVIKHGPPKARDAPSAVASALLAPERLKLGTTIWEFIDVLEVDGAFVAKLAKYVDAGTVETVDTATHRSDSKSVGNLLDAASRFVYLPSESLICCQRVNSKISTAVFQDRFERLVTGHRANLFQDVTLAPIDDRDAFADRIRGLASITTIDAIVFPPNPLYGRFWKPLDAFLKRRRASTLHIKEEAEGDAGLQSRICELVSQVTEDVGPNDGQRIAPETSPNSDCEDPIDLPDAAILMAADGYGTARIGGVDRVTARNVWIPVGEQPVSITVPAGATDFELLAEVRRSSTAIIVNRQMRHRDET